MVVELSSPMFDAQPQDLEGNTYVVRPDFAAGNYEAVISMAPGLEGVEIRDVTIQGERFATTSQPGLFIDGLRDSLVENVTVVGMDEGIKSCGVQNTTFRHCQMTKCRQGFHGEYAAASNGWTHRDVTIEHCMVTDGFPHGNASNISGGAWSAVERLVVQDCYFSSRAFTMYAGFKVVGWHHLTVQRCHLPSVQLQGTQYQPGLHPPEDPLFHGAYEGNYHNHTTFPDEGNLHGQPHQSWGAWIHDNHFDAGLTGSWTRLYILAHPMTGVHLGQVAPNRYTISPATQWIVDAVGDCIVKVYDHEAMPEPAYSKYRAQGGSVVTEV